MKLPAFHTETIIFAAQSSSTQDIDLAFPKGLSLELPRNHL
jgi:hypothetical protein